MRRQFRQPGSSPLPNREKASRGPEWPMPTLPPHRPSSPLRPGTRMGRCWLASIRTCRPTGMRRKIWRPCLVSPALPDRSKSPPRRPSSVCRSMPKLLPYSPPCLRGKLSIPSESAMGRHPGSSTRRSPAPIRPTSRGRCAAMPSGRAVYRRGPGNGPRHPHLHHPAGVSGSRDAVSVIGVTSRNGNNRTLSDSRRLGKRRVGVNPSLTSGTGC